MRAFFGLREVVPCGAFVGPHSAQPPRPAGRGGALTADLTYPRRIRFYWGGVANVSGRRKLHASGRSGIESLGPRAGGRRRLAAVGAPTCGHLLRPQALHAGLRATVATPPQQFRIRRAETKSAVKAPPRPGGARGLGGVGTYKSPAGNNLTLTKIGSSRRRTGGGGGW